ncbi:MAG: VWA domain-containing protein [Patescibacteria group bacterium]
MVALDVSLSMQAEDLKPNRIEAAKNIIVKFLDTLVSDRVGLVVFS